MPGQVSQVWRTWDIKQQEFVQRNWGCEQQCSSDRSTSLEQIFVEWGEIYLQNEKFKSSDVYWKMRVIQTTQKSS